MQKKHTDPLNILYLNVAHVPSSLKIVSIFSDNFGGPRSLDGLTPQTTRELFHPKVVMSGWVSYWIMIRVFQGIGYAYPHI